jgi:hypothetical protein
MRDAPYDTLATVFEWARADALLTPEGAAAAFGGDASP